MTAVLIAIFLISAATLGLELVLVRALSIGHWHHFSYLVISTALLGFAAGGTFVSLCPRMLTANYRRSLWMLAVGLAVTVPASFWICQKVPFDELQLIWDRRQIIYLFGYYLLLFIPFLCAGISVAVVFTVFSDSAQQLYFYNMAGSGIGAAMFVGLMYGNSPEELLLVISITAMLAALVLAWGQGKKIVSFTLFCGAICLVVFRSGGLLPLKIKISEHKAIVYYQVLPDSETVATDYSPLGRIDCIEAAAIRYFPGLSIGYKGQLPEQALIITDGDGVSAINHFRDQNDFGFFDWMTSAIGYHMVSQPETCVIGAGGGGDVAQALVLGASRVFAVEMNQQVIDLMGNKLSDFSGGLYNRSDVEVISAEGRNFLQTTKKKFDVINISLLDSFSASAAGLYALNESHLYTIEAIEQAIERLGPNGLLSITRMLKTPPRDSLKILATVAQALHRRGVKEPGRYIIMIRSWATATIIAGTQPFTDLQIEKARTFARQRGFDLVHVPGIKEEEVNRFHKLPEPVYYESAQRILSPQYEAFYRDYAYNIRPATDDQPYFFNFFRWKALPHMMETIVGQWLPFSEWGYLALVATLLQAIFASVVFILLPLRLARPLKDVKSDKFAVLSYFMLLGFAYMFLEMGFIQKMTLLIGHPVLGVAVTLTGFLLFSGCGAFLSQRIFKSGSGNPIQKAVLIVFVIGLAEIVVLKFSFAWLIGYSQPIRIIMGLLIILPLAFFMGMPFPMGLRQIGSRGSALVPWAWGINGFASVTGAVLGTLLAISAGFTNLVFVAACTYLLAGMISRRLFR
jgi:spermidine synthase